MATLKPFLSLRGDVSTTKKLLALRTISRLKDRVAGLVPNLSPDSLAEKLPYIEVAGYRLALQNHGEPMCPEIMRNEEKASETDPQAWSKEINWQTHWYYNYPGACAEARYLGKRIPTPQEWLEMMGAVEGSVIEKAKALNIPMVDHRDAHDNKFENDNDAVLWAHTGDDNRHPECIILKGDQSYVTMYKYGGGHAMWLRFFHPEA